MRFHAVLFPLLLVPQILAAQVASETWFAASPTTTPAGHDITLFAAVWALDETPAGNVEFQDRGTTIITEPLVPLASGHGRIAAGGSHNCAIGIAGEVWCWGWNGDRQLGIGTLADEPSPVMVQGLPEPVTQIASGARHTCAITQSQSVWCWGYNGNGELGAGDNIQHFAPVQVVGLAAAAVEIAAGEWHNCAVLGNGEVWCWGSNLFGVLGDGTSNIALSPVMVSSLPGRAEHVGAGLNHTCAILRNTRVFCWGRNQFGQLGDGTTNDSAVAVGVLAGRNATMVALADYHTCMLRNNGIVRCWGRNSSGELGDGTNTDRATPARAAAAGRDVVAIDANFSHTCAVRWQGRVRCWGRNNTGQLGNGSTLNSNTGATVLLPNARWAWAVATSRNGGCAQGIGGSISCWGYNTHGEVGNGTTTGPYLATPVATAGGARLAWPRATAYARHTVSGGWGVGTRRLRVWYPGSATVAASLSNRIDIETVP